MAMFSLLARCVSVASLAIPFESETDSLFEIE